MELLKQLFGKRTISRNSQIACFAFSRPFRYRLFPMGIFEGANVREQTLQHFK